ncbi:helix-turn-helix domain-containing protein [Nonomuraea sp. NPDC050328]|uniref:helix-turn-helix domain-containing protein n=1 Tax=Nonomuraea sp. NPDC050328 TaxID=3364361 RepID=UPI0037A4BF38
MRSIRKDAGLLGRQLAERAGWDASKVSRIECGRRPPSADDVRVWCEVCGAADQAPDLVSSLEAIEGTYVTWRELERSGLAVSQRAVIPRWERTNHFRIYSSKLIPGPLQTASYVKAILTTLRRRRGLADDIDEAVRVRMGKQHVINDPHRRFAILLEENVLRHPIGGAEAMAGQLGHLLTTGVLPNVSLGIIPLGAVRTSAWPMEGFWMFDDSEVTVELVSGHLTLTQAHEVGAYAAVFSDLAELAMYGKGARELITSALAALDA